MLVKLVELACFEGRFRDQLKVFLQKKAFLQKEGLIKNKSIPTQVFLVMHTLSLIGSRRGKNGIFRSISFMIGFIIFFGFLS